MDKWYAEYDIICIHVGRLYVIFNPSVNIELFLYDESYILVILLKSSPNTDISPLWITYNAVLFYRGYYVPW